MKSRMVYHFIVAFRRVKYYLKVIDDFEKYPKKCAGIIGLVAYYLLMLPVIIVLFVVQKLLSVIILSWFSKLPTLKQQKYLMLSRKVFNRV